MKELARTIQNPKEESQREALRLLFWVLFPKQSLQRYIMRMAEILD